MVEGKVTLTCGHTNATPVGIWEPEIDRHGNRCRSYSTYCPACAEDASFVMVEQIEALEAKVKRLREALAQSLGSLKFAQAHIPAADAKIFQRRIDLVRDVLIQASAQEGEE